MSNNEINYVEFPARDLEATKQFFTEAFSWSFVDYGPDYCSIEKQGIDGGFYRADLQSESSKGGALVVLYSDSLADCLEQVKSAGGSINKPIFEFPGGKRFHFVEPSGNELAVWSDK